MQTFLKALGDILRGLIEAHSNPPSSLDARNRAETPETPGRESPVEKKPEDPKYNFVAQKAKQMYAVRDINVRVGAPNLAAEPTPAPKGKIFTVMGYVTNGEEVNEVSLWYQDAEGNYIWSPNLNPLEFERILHSPLKELMCTQEFGERPEVYKRYGSPKGHNGLDFRTWVNGDPSKWEQPVFAVLDGKVSKAGYDPKYNGNFVRIVHPNGHESVYLHLAKLGVADGQSVQAGVQIGISGNSGGASEAPHLHFGYRPVKYDAGNGHMGYIDPAPLFKNEIRYV